MAKIGREDFTIPTKPTRVFTEAELSKFHEELQERYLVKQTLTNQEEVSVIDFVQYHIDKGTLSKDAGGHIAIVIDFDSFDEPTMPNRYERLEEKIRQYKTWLSHKEYGRRMKLQELSKLAETVKVRYSIDSDAI